MKRRVRTLASVCASSDIGVIFGPQLGGAQVIRSCVMDDFPVVCIEVRAPGGSCKGPSRQVNNVVRTWWPLLTNARS